MRVFSQWNFKPVKEMPKAEVPHKSAVQKTVKILGIRPVQSASNLSTSRSQLMLDQVLKLSASKAPLDLKLEHKLDKGNDHTEQVSTPEDGILRAVVEEGIFEAARLANPILPQYHPQGTFVDFHKQCIKSVLTKLFSSHQNAQLRQDQACQGYFASCFACAQSKQKI
jgi:hypothetical protein